MGLCKRCGTVITGNVEGEYCAFCEVEIDTKKKKCEICGEYFIPNSNRQKYCDKCKKEAELEKYRRYNKKRSKVEQLGTSTMGKHPNNDFEREKEIVKNEHNRLLKVVTVYKGKYSYAKGKMKFANNDQPIGQYGIQLTHNYGTLDDYHQTALNYIMKQQPKKCPDCNQTETNKDRKHAEIQCSNCGLVLMGPYDLRIKYPFMEYPPLNDEPNNLDPMSWYPKKESYKKERGFDTISFDKTPVKVICSRCKKSATIPYNTKEDGCPICGGHYMGVGICMPHDFDDEFATGKGGDRPYDMRTTEDRPIGE